MARIRAGMFSSIDGPVGPLFYRRKKNGTWVVVPRKRHDRRSAPQLAERSYFRQVMSYLSRLYLPLIKPYRRYWRKDETPLSDAAKHSLLYRSSWFNVHYILLYPFSATRMWFVSIIQWSHAQQPFMFFYQPDMPDVSLTDDIRLFFIRVNTGELYIDNRTFHKDAEDVDLPFVVPVGVSNYYAYVFAVYLDMYGIYHLRGWQAFTFSVTYRP